MVRIPASVESLLDPAEKRKATRLKLRVVTKRYGKLTTLRLSPIVLSSRGRSAACGTGNDGDSDLLGKALELRYALDPCKKDTDGDGAEDGWEYWAAKDLNAKAVPYPGKKPYPNPLAGGRHRHRLRRRLPERQGPSSGCGWPPARSFDPSGRQRPARLGPGLQRRRPRPAGPTRRPRCPTFKVFTQPASASYPAALRSMRRRRHLGATTSATPTPTA